MDGHGPTPPTPRGFFSREFGFESELSCPISAAFFPIISGCHGNSSLFHLGFLIKALYNEDAKQASFMMGTDALSILSFDAETGEEEQAVSEYQPAT